MDRCGALDNADAGGYVTCPGEKWIGRESAAMHPLRPAEKPTERAHRLAQIDPSVRP